jgi:dienelactone hydrolase
VKTENVQTEAKLIHLVTGTTTLEGDLTVPARSGGVVLFAHGSGSSRHSPRNRHVADVLHKRELATLLMDLLTCEEEKVDSVTGHLRFDIGLLARRLVAAIDWLQQIPPTHDLAIGCFGASTGAGAALVAASERPAEVRAVVSRGGRPDLAGPILRRVGAPTLLIVGSQDSPVIGLNWQAFDQLGTAEKDLVLVPGATHLFEEPGTLDEVARLAGDWFTRHLAPCPSRG